MTQYNKEDYINYRLIKAKESLESGRTFNKLFEMRNRGDYNDLFEFDEKSVVELFKPVEKLINEVNNLLSD